LPDDLRQQATPACGIALREIATQFVVLAERHALAPNAALIRREGEGRGRPLELGIEKTVPGNSRSAG
jgi:hypothetical protein